MPIKALPVAPTRSDPVNFNSRADAFLSALPTFATEANALQDDVNAKQTAAATSAANALASENAANAAANVTAWVSGTTYAIGNVRYSPITFLSYRRKTAGAGTTDPSADSTNWQLINGTGNVDLNSTQTLTNKEIGSGSTVNGIPVANLVNTTANQTVGGVKTFTGTVNLSDTGFRFSSDGSQDTGMYWVADGRIGFITNEVGIGEINTNGLDMPVLPSRVANANAALGVGAVGTYAILFSASSVTYSYNYAGSSLRAQGMARASDNVLTTPNGTGNLQTGTWKCFGTFASSTGGLALFLRIA